MNIYTAYRLSYYTVHNSEEANGPLHFNNDVLLHTLAAIAGTHAVLVGDEQLRALEF